MLQYLKYISLCCLLWFVGTGSMLYGQSNPVISNFSFNPYLYNPAFAGSEGYTALFVGHRQQWLGVEGAPSVSLLSLHSPITRNLAVGGQLRQKTAGAISEQTILLSPAYVIPFGEQHNLRFGLAAGIILRSLSLQDATPEQQVYLANYSLKNLQYNFQFGINYVFHNFSLGLALPSLNRQYLIDDSSQTAFFLEPLNEYLASASYFYRLPNKKIALEPSLIYHHFNQASTRIEGGLMVHAAGLVMAGASYRSDYGPSILLGVNLKKVSVAYSYELGHTGLGIGQSTHEIQAHIQLGQEKTYSKEIQHRPRFEF